MTIAFDHYGDSVVNALTDIAATWLRFWLARVLPVRAGIGIFLAAEAVTIRWIRDGLLVWPPEGVRVWQGRA